MKEMIIELLGDYKARFRTCISQAEAHERVGNHKLFMESMKAASGHKLMINKYEEMLSDFKQPVVKHNDKTNY